MFFARARHYARSVFAERLRRKRGRTQPICHSGGIRRGRIVRGNEFFLLREAETSDITAVSSENIADAIACLRDGKVHWNPGFDGQFGTMELVHPFRQLNSD